MNFTLDNGIEDFIIYKQFDDITLINKIFFCKKALLFQKKSGNLQTVLEIFSLKTKEKRCQEFVKLQEKKYL